MPEPLRNMKPAAIYLRRSTDKQDRSIEDQRAEIHRYAEDHGYELVREYVDDAISGASTIGRKSFKRMIEDAKRPHCPFRFILVYDIKRFSRGDTDEAGHYRFLLKEKGIDWIRPAFIYTPIFWIHCTKSP